MVERKYSATLLHAAADGVAPAIIFSAPNEAAQYLFNVPEGFSRLVLEHKLRPSARLSCVLLTSLNPSATGGLGGLTLRLAQDGHGQLQLIGPIGTAAFMHSMRHIFRWLHPKVFASECHPNRFVPVFEDEHIIIVPLMAGDESSKCPWCASVESMDDTRKQDLMAVSAIHGADMECSEIPCNGADDLIHDGRVDASETSSTSKGDTMTRSADLLSKISKKLAASKHLRKKTCARSLQMLINQRTSNYLNSSGEDAKVQAAQAPAQDKKRQPSFGWLITNSQEHNLPSLMDDSNPVFIKDPSGSVYAFETMNDQCARISNGIGAILGYVCYMKDLNAGVLIVDCSSLELLEKVQVHPLIKCMQQKPHKVSAVIHLSPMLVANSEIYLSWIDTFDESVEHILMHGGIWEFGYRSSLRTLAKLNLVNKALFPLPFNSHEGEQISPSLAQKPRSKITPSKLLMTFNIWKEAHVLRSCIDCSKCLDHLKIQKFQENLISKIPELVNLDRYISSPLTANQVAAAKLKKLLLEERDPFFSLPDAEVPCKDSICTINHTGSVDNMPDPQSTGSQFQAVFLGTGSAEPSKFRGSSGILVQTGTRGSILLDAGEGVMGQIVRKYGNEVSIERLNSIECIWLSHKHADHVLGLISIIRARERRALPVVIIGPSVVKEWLLEIKHAYELVSSPFPPLVFLHAKEFIDRQDVNGSPNLNGEYIQHVLEELQLRKIQTVGVDHCFEAYGLLLFAQDGSSLVYSGDTRPCSNLVRAGAGCTILIHEATFEEKLISHARRKRHSTVAEALHVSKAMQVEQVILTHFSQRYPKVVEFDISNDLGACMAFDGMVVEGSNLARLKGLVPALRLVLSDDTDGEVPLNAATKLFDMKHHQNPSAQVQHHIQNVDKFCNIPATKDVSSKHVRWVDTDSSDGEP